jgi:hypothetical protein
MTLSLEDLMAMNRAQLHSVLENGHPLDLDALADTQYLGVDLSLPSIGHKLLWQTFRKTFHRDGDTLRGWNVKMEQHGVRGRMEPKRDRHGNPTTFGHYHVRSAEGMTFARGWTGAQFLDYGAAANLTLDLARFGYCPLVAVNAGSSELLMGWEIFKVGPAWLPLPLYWALELQGPLEQTLPEPKTARSVVSGDPQRV